MPHATPASARPAGLRRKFAPAAMAMQSLVVAGSIRAEPLVVVAMQLRYSTFNPLGAFRPQLLYEGDGLESDQNISSVLEADLLR